MLSAVNVVAWLIGSKAGRITLIVATSAAIIGLAIIRAYRGGRNHEKALQAQRRLENLQNAIAVEKDVRNLPRDVRRERVSKWLRSD